MIYSLFTSSVDFALSVLSWFSKHAVGCSRQNQIKEQQLGKPTFKKLRFDYGEVKEHPGNSQFVCKRLHEASAERLARSTGTKQHSRHAEASSRRGRIEDMLDALGGILREGTPERLMQMRCFVAPVIDSWEKAFLVHDLLSETECSELILATEPGLQLQQVTGATGFRENYRGSFYEKDVADVLWERLRHVGAVGVARRAKMTPGVSYKESVPSETTLGTPVGVSSHLRVEKYKPGQSFRIHCDASVNHASGKDFEEVTVFSVVIYLNSASPTGEEDKTCSEISRGAGFTGGNTNFVVDRLGNGKVPIAPRAGTALLFRHELLHEGAAVTSGTKYICRTDLIFRFSKMVRD